MDASHPGSFGNTAVSLVLLEHVVAGTRGFVTGAVMACPELRETLYPRRQASSVSPVASRFT